MESVDRLRSRISEMRLTDVTPLAVVIRLKEEGLVPSGQEFNAAHILKQEYNLTVLQLHEVVGWFKGERSLEHLSGMLSG